MSAVLRSPLSDLARTAPFGIAPECAVRTGFYRSNLTLLTNPIHAADRDEALLQRLRTRKPGSTIIYVTLQRTAERVAKMLGKTGFEAQAYHAGMENGERAQVQDWFLSSNTAIVVATIAFGMGIDKPNIRYVYHYNLPKSLENFAQEIGRAGRDGLPSTCEMFVCLDDLNVLQNFAYGDTPGLKEVRSFLEEILSSEDELEFSLYDLSVNHDIRLLVVRTLLTYLELNGYLQAGTPSFSSFRFRPLQSSEQILSQFEGDRQQFLRGLFGQSKKAQTWFDIDLEQAAQALGASRDRIVRALDYLAEQQMLELKSSGVRHHYHLLRRPEDMDSLAQALHKSTLDHESREIARLGQILELAEHDGCQTSYLSNHFGESLGGPCGHCSWCLNSQQPAKLLPSPPVTIDENIWNQATSLRREESEALKEPRALARFLTGLTSPLLTRKKLSRHQLFGSLGHVPFPQIMERARGERGEGDK